MATKESAAYSVMSPGSPSSEAYKISQESRQSEDSIALLSQDDESSFRHSYLFRSKKQRLVKLLLCSLPWLLTLIFASLSLALYLSVKNLTCPYQNENQESNACSSHTADSSSSSYENAAPESSHRGIFGSYEAGFSTDLGMAHISSGLHVRCRDGDFSSNHPQKLP
jgi:hypothetical protein